MIQRKDIEGNLEGTAGGMQCGGPIVQKVY
jgi:hypothetical protein